MFHLASSFTPLTYTVFSLVAIPLLHSATRSKLGCATKNFESLAGTHSGTIPRHSARLGHTATIGAQLEPLIRILATNNSPQYVGCIPLRI